MPFPDLFITGFFVYKNINFIINTTTPGKTPATSVHLRTPRLISEHTGINFKFTKKIVTYC